ncbi:ABC transporter substrate-binding protein [Massilia sp. 9096]|uniref:substrate-binding periplasmic protein n=1 Tax=Massilia sp. 9096 TaxID=1500894 RepID=UPI0018CD1C80|nr:transporter substrate-binding domain-containing protein [Massilia sp. 9096]
MQPDAIAAPSRRNPVSKATPRRGRRRSALEGALACALACAIACTLACAPARVHAQARALEVRIAGQEALAPKWVYLRNSVVGICPDILAAVERIEPRLRFAGYRQSRSLPGIEAGLDGGSVDVACALIASERRQAIAERVGPAVYVVRHRLAARSDDAIEVRSVTELARMGALVVGQRGGVFVGTLRAAGVRIDDATDDNGVNLRKVLAGHGRFVEMNEITMQHYLRSDVFEGRLRILPVVIGTEPAYFWVSRKADPAIARLLGPALERLKASGELDRIYAQRTSSP